MKASFSLIHVFLMCMSLNFMCYAQDIYDVETLPTLRTQQYSMFPYKEIIVFSAPRTGSSFVYNVFRYLFEDDSKLFSHHYVFNQDRSVLKTHRSYEILSVEEKNVLYVFIMRHPYDGSISNHRICPFEFKDQQWFAEELAHRHRNALWLSEKLEAEGCNVQRLKYEDFADNPDYLFDFIENHFVLSIAAEDKELIRKGYSKQNVYACTQHFADFTGSLPISGFHGRHINVEDYSPPEDFLYWLKVYIEEIKPFFRKYGYFLNES